MGRFLASGALVICLLAGCTLRDTTPEPDTAWRDRLDNNTDWGIYRGDKKGIQYSELDQINTSNVHLLEPAWEYRHGHPEQPGMYANPIVVDGLLYFTTPRVDAVALDAATGEEVWRFEHAPHNEGRTFRGRNRGVVYWEDENGAHPRIFNFVRDRVYALDAKTGALIESFGDNGFIDLRYNLAVAPDVADIEVTSPGAVYRDYLIVVSRVQEGNMSTPGDVRAYNALTGEFEWIFNTIPLEGQYGYDTWQFEENMHYGGANAWGGVTIDEERGWVFAATGAAAGEFIYGGSRKGENLFSSTVLALDATTGERQWHYQVIRHDIFDYDLPPAPILATITTEDGPRDVAVQLTKMGFIFVLDRDTGEPVFPVVDVPVPPSKVPGEEAWPTQPFPLLPPPLVRQRLYESDLTTITPESHAYALEQFRRYETGPVYTPASIAGVITTPGHLGGLQWHGGAFDPETNVLYVNANEAPTIHILRPLEPDVVPESLTPVQRGANVYNRNCTACHGLDREGNAPFYPPLRDLSKSRDELRSIVVDGLGGMPPFSQFSDGEVDDLLTYLTNDDAELHGLSDPVSGTAPEGSENGVPVWSGGEGPWRWSTTTPQYANVAPFFVDHMGYPAIAPPWGTLSAVDLGTGRILWKIPLGEHPELVEMGIRNTGTVNMGGAVLTAGGVIFIGATQDEKFRAIDKHTGRVLWEYQLPAGGYATPSVYMIDGRQYVVIAAGGLAKPQTRPGDSIIAFALPETRPVPSSLSSRGARDVRIVAHRGAMADRPENTMAAFQRAVELGADVVEIDVRMSRDGRLFVLHDPTLDRTTNSFGPAEDRTFDELRRLDAGAWFDPRFEGESIPSLEEVLTWARGRTVLLLDLKGSSRPFNEAVAASVREAGDPASVVIGVRSLAQARHFRELIPESRQLAFMERPELIAEFVEAGTDVLRLWLHWLDGAPELATEVRESGRILMINGTGGALEEAKAIMHFDPDWILIDDVAQLWRSIAEVKELED